MRSILLLILTLLASILIGQEAFEIKNYQVTINVDQAGRIHVDEILDVYFTEDRRGIIRDVPYIYSINGERYSTDISNVTVDRHPIKVTSKNGNKNIRIGDPDVFVNGNVKYKIGYDVSGAVVRYDDHDEFYWNVIGHESAVGTDVASFSIRFPEEWADSLHNYVTYTGKAGSTASELYVNKIGSKFSAATIAALKPYEGVTFAVEIPKGLVASSFNRLTSSSNSGGSSWNPPSWAKWLVSLPLGLAMLLLGLWKKVVPQGKLEDNPTLQYYPPANFNPAEVGTFDDYTTHTRDIIALLPYWGDLGAITIKPLEGGDGDMYFTKIGELPASSLGYEHYFFEQLFEDGDVVLLSDLKEKFYQTMSTTSSKVKSAVMDRPLYDREYKRVFHNNWFVAAGIFSIMAGITMMIMFKAIMGGIGMLILGIAIIVIRNIEPALSDEGKRIKNHLSGLKTWLSDPAPVKLNELMTKDPNYLFKMFPYAIAFGLDKSWQKSMDAMHIDPPVWYDTTGLHMTTGGYTMGRMVTDFQPREIAQVFTSTPPPPSGSSGGGFSGGSSGGGMGGGGVSSW